MASPESGSPPNHPFLTQPPHRRNIPRGAQDLSQGTQNSTDNTPTSKRRKIDAPDPQNGKATHLTHQPTNPHGEQTQTPSHQPRSGTRNRNAAPEHLPRPAAEHPQVTRWKRETTQQEPWSSISRMHTEEVERTRNDLISKDGTNIMTRATRSPHRTSSSSSGAAAYYRANASEAEACADLMGVGTWLK